MAQGRKRIVITGATGLIGGQLAQRLIDRGDEVILFVRDPKAAQNQVRGAAAYVQWSSSMADGEWTSFIDGADAIINLAGAPVATRWTQEQKKRIRDSRIQGTRAIVGAIARAAHKPALLLNASAVGYYGTSESRIFTEDSPPGNDFLGEVCSAWEHEAEQAGEFGLRVVLLRTGIVLDPAGGALGKLLPTFRLFVGGPLGSGRQWLPWIHKEDEIGMLLWAIDNEEVKGAVNAVAPGIVSNKKFSDVLGTVLGRPSLFAVPAFALTMVFGEGAVALTQGQNVVPERTQRLGYRFLHPDLEGALRDLLKA